MAIQDYFDYPVAYNPTAEGGTGALVPDAEFQVYAVDDTSFSTPLAVTEPVSGAAISPLKSSSVGVLPSFRVTGDPTEVIIRSGPFATRLASKYGIVWEAGLDPVTVQAAVAAGQLAAQSKTDAETARAAAVAARNAAEEAAGRAEAVGETNDDITESLIKTDGTKTKAALTDTIGAVVETAVADLQPNMPGNVYVPSMNAARKWRARRGAVGARTKVGRINGVGDSILQGAAETGSSSPKDTYSWMGRLRSRMDAAFGHAGSGIIWCRANLRANPTWEPRFAFSGDVTDTGYGIFRSAAFSIGPGGVFSFTDIATEFVIYSRPGAGGVANAAVDDGTAKTFRNEASGSGYDLPPLYPTGTVVTVVPVGGEAAQHTLKITAGSNRVEVLGVEARIAGSNGRWSFTNSGYNGKSFQSGGFGTTNNSSPDGSYGRALLIDTPQADLTFIALGVNDWQTWQSGGKVIPVAELKANMKTYATNAVQAARASGTNNYGQPRANGDAMLVVVPRPSNVDEGFEAYREAFYEVADEQDVLLIDMADRWGSYAISNSYGQHADPIHPSDIGAQDFADAVFSAAFGDLAFAPTVGASTPTPPEPPGPDFTTGLVYELTGEALSGAIGTDIASWPSSAGSASGLAFVQSSRSGGGNTVTYPMPSVVAGPGSHKAAHFDKALIESLTANATLGIDSPMTVAFVLRMASVTGATQQFVSSFEAARYSFSATATAGALRLNNAQGGVTTIQAPSGIPLNQWVFVAGVANGAGSFIVTNADVVTGTLGEAGTLFDRVTIGAAAQTPTSSPLDGDIAVHRVWDRALTASELAAYRQSLVTAGWLAA